MVDASYSCWRFRKAVMEMAAADSIIFYMNRQICWIHEPEASSDSSIKGCESN